MELEKIKAIIAEVLNIDADSITEDTTFVDDLGADSLDIFQIIMGIEEEYDIELDNDLSNRFRQSVMLLKQFGQLNKNVTVRQSEI